MINSLSISAWPIVGLLTWLLARMSKWRGKSDSRPVAGDRVPRAYPTLITPAGGGTGEGLNQ